MKKGLLLIVLAGALPALRADDTMPQMEPKESAPMMQEEKAMMPEVTEAAPMKAVMPAPETKAATKVAGMSKEERIKKLGNIKEALKTIKEEIAAMKPIKEKFHKAMHEFIDDFIDLMLAKIDMHQEKLETSK